MTTGARDPRLTLARPDLALSALRGEVQAERYADGKVMQVIVAQAPVRGEPYHGAPLLTEALYGEKITVVDIDENGWAWGQLMGDGYVGWIPVSALVGFRDPATHRVAVPRTFLFPEPSVKAPPIDSLPMNAALTVLRTQPPFAVTSEGFVPAAHLREQPRYRDHVAVAEMFLHVPYLWGGRTNAGIDCSGLVQTALSACDFPCPRDSDMQEDALGIPAGLSEAVRGDLIFWKGHVAIVRDRDTLIHANAHHMMVAIEPISEAVARIATTGSAITSVRHARWNAELSPAG